MFAVIHTLGRQYKVSVGDVIRVDRISKDNEDVAVGKKVKFNEVLLVSDDEGTSTKVGAPLLNGATVTGEIKAQDQDDKGVAFKKKRRKGYRRKVGFRRAFTEVLITEIKAA